LEIRKRLQATRLSRIWVKF